MNVYSHSLFPFNLFSILLFSIPTTRFFTFFPFLSRFPASSPPPLSHSLSLSPLAFLTPASFFFSFYSDTNVLLSPTALRGVFQGYKGPYTRLRDSASHRYRFAREAVSRAPRDHAPKVLNSGFSTAFLAREPPTIRGNPCFSHRAQRLTIDVKHGACRSYASHASILIEFPSSTALPLNNEIFREIRVPRNS